MVAILCYLSLCRIDLLPAVWSRDCLLVAHLTSPPLATLRPPRPNTAGLQQEAHPVDVAFNLNRSIVGFHAKDIIRAARAVAAGTLSGQPPMPVVATISANDTAAAVLSAGLIAATTPAAKASLGHIGVLSSIVSWAMIAQTERYYMGALVQLRTHPFGRFNAPM